MQRWVDRRAPCASASTQDACFNDAANVSVVQVPGAVQAGQSVREVHPGSAQERQQRVLQAQEQPPAGGVGAHNGVVQCGPRQPPPRPSSHHP